MPTYPAYKTYRGGFYNSKNTNGIDDRVYTAEDIRKPYDTIYSDGVMPEADGTAGENLKVSLSGDMVITISAGNAKIGGAWFENTAAYNITLDTASGTDRYDAIIIRNDDSDTVRDVDIYIKSLSAAPKLSDLVRNDDIYEICIGYVYIPAFASSISASNVIDTREDGSLCNIMSGVGATVVRTYHNTYYSEAVGQTVIPIGISQYNRTRDRLTVIVEGRVFAEGTNYSIANNEQITLNIGLPVVGTRIDFEVAKNVNAAGAESVVQEVGNLVTEVNAINKTLEHHYYCNGVNDNINLSRIAQNWINASTNNDSMCVYVHGHFGALNPYTGAGTDASPYQWLSLGGGSAQTRRAVFDFSDCSQIHIACSAGTYNTIVYGLHVDIIGANIIATGGQQITMFSRPAKTFVNADRCRFWITSQTGYIARGGCFRDCRVSLTVDADNAYAFNVMTGGLLRIFGGEYYAYAPSANFSAVVYVNAAQTGAVVNTYSMCCPTFSRNPYVQTYAVNCLTGDACCSFTDTITPLEIVAAGQNVRGTITQNISGTI